MNNIHAFKSGMRGTAAWGAALLLAATLPARGELVLHPKQVGASVDLGQIASGYSADQGEAIENFPITRTGVYMTVGGTYNDKLDIRLTTGGLFWFAASVKQGDVVNRTLKFGPGVGQAQGIYTIGQAGDPNASKLQFGLFPVKYSDAHNLGEYLYRSGTYPGTMVTGGWSYVNSASYLAQGVRYTLPMFGGKLVHEITAFMERDWEPLHDITPGYAVTYKPNNFVTLGGGIVWAHGIPLRSGDALSLKVRKNAYSKRSNRPVEGAAVFGVKDSVVFNTPNDPASGVDTVISDTTSLERLTLRDWAACEAGDCSNIGYYTFRGFKAAARAAFDVGVLLGNPMIRPDDFKLYGEVALLGFENYPYYYEDRLERMPVMLGLNVPTFGILDRLSAEVEYRKTRFRNSIYGVNRELIPVPITSGSGSLGGYEYIDAVNDDDDWRWSFYANRKITDGVSLTGQVASDNQRHPDFWGVFGYQPATQTSKNWYYVVRLDFGIF